MKIEEGGEYHKKMGTVDRVVMGVFAIVFAILYFPRSISGTAAIILGFLVNIILFKNITAACLLYRPLGISTMKKEK
jgi:hypothetical protein